MTTSAQGFIPLVSMSSRHCVDMYLAMSSMTDCEPPTLTAIHTTQAVVRLKTGRLLKGRNGPLRAPVSLELLANMNSSVTTSPARGLHHYPEGHHPLSNLTVHAISWRMPYRRIRSTLAVEAPALLELPSRPPVCVLPRSAVARLGARALLLATALLTCFLAAPAALASLCWTFRAPASTVSCQRQLLQAVWAVAQNHLQS